MPDYGPFAVDPTKVSGLGGARFGQFVSRLLAAEQAVAAVKGSILDTLSIENMADAGVDARLRHAEATTWVPTGDSAWQFKAGDLSPAECKAELEARPHSVDCVVRSIHVAHRGSKDKGTSERGTVMSQGIVDRRIPSRQIRPFQSSAPTRLSVPIRCSANP